MPQALALNYDALDDPIIGDGTPSFGGGMVYNEQPSLLAENESAYMLNMDRTRTGKATTRKGCVKLGSGPVDSGIIQGMTYFFTKDYSYLVAACNKKIYKFESGTWTQIATGGILDDDSIEIVKTGNINNASGYAIGDGVTADITVDGFTGSVTDGLDKFILSQQDKYFEYLIVAHTDTAGNVTGLRIAAPGLVDKTYDNSIVIIKREGAQVNNGGGYAGGTTTIAIDNILGDIKNGDKFRVIGEEVIHTISSHTTTAGNVTGLTFTPAIQGAYSASSATVWIMFANGLDKIYWCDGVGDIYSWDGQHTGRLQGNIWDYGAFPPPSGCSVLVWFQNRLIASGIATEPDAVYFSDILDATRWDNNFNKIRVGGGESDPIVMLVPWNDLNLACFKEHSAYVINMDPSQNPVPEDSTLLVSSFAIRMISRHIGCASPRAIQQVGGTGGDIFFLGSDRQVRSLRRTVAAEAQQELGQALSLQIKNSLDHIPKANLHNVVAFYFSSRYFLATPLDTDFPVSAYPQSVWVWDGAFSNWSGRWTWKATSFSSMSIAAGVIALAIGRSDGTVYQWLEDTSPDEGLATTYQDDGVDYQTWLLTRAYTLGDLFSTKTGLYLELEFTDSLATIVVYAVIDQQNQLTPLLLNFPTTSLVPLRLPFVIPAVLPGAVFVRAEKDLHQLGQFRDLQLDIASFSGKLSLRTIKMTGFMDTLQLQTLGDTPLP
jgi:hypothetical protein